MDITEDIVRVANDTSKYICYLCQHSFSQNHNLQKHLKDNKCKFDIFKVNAMMKVLFGHDVVLPDENTEIKNKEYV